MSDASQQLVCRRQACASGSRRQGERHVANADGWQLYRKHAATEPPTPGTNRPPELQKLTFTHTSPVPMPPPAALAAIAACRAGRTCKFCFVTLAQILANVLCTGPFVLRYQCSGQGSCLRPLGGTIRQDQKNSCELRMQIKSGKWPATQVTVFRNS